MIENLALLRVIFSSEDAASRAVKGLRCYIYVQMMQHRVPFEGFRGRCCGVLRHVTGWDTASLKCMRPLNKHS